ncbi:MAG: hypothetical protein ACQ9IQ_11775 [Nitrospirales bacterium]
MQLPKTEPDSVYRVNADNIIESVDSGWLSFALANDASHLSAEAVIGQPLFRFITGKETQYLYQVMIERVRSNQRKVVIPFRCDGPSHRRFMVLEISPGTNRQVQFTVCTTREDERKRISLLDPLVNRTGEYLSMCSWCKRIDVAGNWLDVEVAVKQLELFNETSLPQITHSICNDCYDWMRHEILSQKYIWENKGLLCPKD